MARVNPCKTKIDVNSSKEDIQIHIGTMMEQTSDGKNKWKCTVCGKATRYRADLSRHIESRIEGLLYHCDQCGKVVKSINALQTHVSRSHKL